MRKAVEMATEQICHEEIECAILQSRSPSCGVNEVYDGSFTGKLISGSGIFTESLKKAGFRVIDAVSETLHDGSLAVGLEHQTDFLFCHSRGFAVHIP